MATFSSLLRTTGSKGQIGVPSREVTPIDVIVFDRVQNFLLSISESIALEANPNVLFTELHDALGHYAGRTDNLTYITESVDKVLERSRTINKYSTAYSGSIPSLHNANTITLDGKIVKFPSQSFTRSFSDDNGRGIVNDEGSSMVTHVLDSFSNLAHTQGMKIPLNIAESPTLSSRFNKFAESSSNYIPWFHTLKDLENRYSGSSNNPNLQYGGEFLLKNFFNFNYGNFHLQNKGDFPIFPSINNITSSTNMWNQNDFRTFSASVWDLNKDHGYYKGSSGTGDISLLKRPIPSFDKENSNFYSYHLTGKGIRYYNKESPYPYQLESFDLDGNFRFNKDFLTAPDHVITSESLEYIIQNSFHPRIPLGTLKYTDLDSAIVTKVTKGTFSFNYSPLGTHGNLSTWPAVGMLSGMGKDAIIDNSFSVSSPLFRSADNPYIPFKAFTNTSSIGYTFSDEQLAAAGLAPKVRPFRIHYPWSGSLSETEAGGDIDPADGSFSIFGELHSDSNPSTFGWKNKEWWCNNVLKSASVNDLEKPTGVINKSLGGFINTWIYQRSASMATGSFSFPESSQGHLKGIRINYLNKDYCFISCSSNISNPITASAIILSAEGTPNDWPNTKVGEGKPITPDGTNDNTFRTMINDVTSSLDLAINGRKCRSNLYFYHGTNGIVDLVDTINKISNAHQPGTISIPGDEVYSNDSDPISGSYLWNYWGFKGMCHFTASNSGDTLILSSSRETYGEIKIFTGSLEQFFGLQANPQFQREATYNGDSISYSYGHRIELDFTPQTPYGGSHTLTLVCKGNDTGSSGWKTIFHKGQDMYSTAISNLHSSCRHKEIYPQARYGWPRFHNHDHFGIDNGWNHLGPPMPDYQNVPDYGKYVKFLNQDPESALTWYPYFHLFAHKSLGYDDNLEALTHFELQNLTELTNNNRFQATGDTSVSCSIDVFGFAISASRPPAFNSSQRLRDPNFDVHNEFSARGEGRDSKFGTLCATLFTSMSGIWEVQSAGNEGAILAQTSSLGHGEDLYFDPIRYHSIADDYIIHKPATDGFYYDNNNWFIPIQNPVTKESIPVVKVLADGTYISSSNAVSGAYSGSEKRVRGPWTPVPYGFGKPGGPFTHPLANLNELGGPSGSFLYSSGSVNYRGNAFHPRQIYNSLSSLTVLDLDDGYSKFQNNIRNQEKVFSFNATYFAYGEPHKDLQDRKIFTKRPMMPNGTNIVAGAVPVASHNFHLGGCDLEGMKDDSALVNGPGNLGFGRIYPSLNASTEYNFGPGVDTYSAFQFLRYPMNKEAVDTLHESGLSFEEISQDNSNTELQVTLKHSIFRELEGKENITTNRINSFYRSKSINDVMSKLIEVDNIKKSHLVGKFSASTQLSAAMAPNRFMSTDIDEGNPFRDAQLLEVTSPLAREILIHSGSPDYFNDDFIFNMQSADGSGSNTPYIKNIISGYTGDIYQTSSNAYQQYAIAGGGGGTSTSGPVIAGAALLYKQINPTATVLDFRRFLNFYDNKVGKDQGVDAEIMYHGHMSASNLNTSNPQYSDPRYHIYRDGAVSGSITGLRNTSKQSGPTAKGFNPILRFPFNSGFKRRYSGSLNFKRK